MKLSIINGPNLNMLGSREKDIYGSFSLSDLEKFLKENILQQAELDFFQSNHESEIVQYIHKAKSNNIEGIIINAAAYTHTSISIRDSLLAVNIPFIEVHISNIYKREEFRHKSFLADIAQGVITGLGKEGYLFAIEYFLRTNGKK